MPAQPGPATSDAAPKAMTKGSYRRTWPRPLVLLLVVLLLSVIGLGGYILYYYYQARGPLEDANRAIKRRDFVEAGKHLDKYLELRPDSPAVQFLAARTARRAGAYDKAEEHLAKAQKLGWTPEAIELERLMLAAQRGEISEDGEKYLHSFTQKQPEHEDVPIILEALTKGYMKSFKLFAANQCLDRWLEREPGNVQALLWRGWVRGHLNNHSGALEDYERAVEAAPDDVEARMRLADSLVANLQYQQAFEHYQRLHECLPDQPDVLLGLAVCREGLGQPEQAKQLLDQLLNDKRFAEILGPKPVVPLRLPAQLSPETVAWVRQCLQYAPLEMRQPDYLLSIYTGALFKRGELALRAKDYKRGEECLKLVVKLAPYNPLANERLALCLEQHGNKDEAKKYRAKAEALKEQMKKFQELSEQIARVQRDPDLRCQIGELLLQMGNAVEGLRWLESALRDDPQHERTRQVLEEYDRQTAARRTRPSR
jgi:tetratricopeptide (TPR) repeat protein